MTSNCLGNFSIEISFVRFLQQILLKSLALQLLVASENLELDLEIVDLLLGLVIFHPEGRILSDLLLEAFLQIVFWDLLLIFTRSLRGVNVEEIRINRSTDSLRMLGFGFQNVVQVDERIDLPWSTLT